MISTLEHLVITLIFPVLSIHPSICPKHAEIFIHRYSPAHSESKDQMPKSPQVAPFDVEKRFPLDDGVPHLIAKTEFGQSAEKAHLNSLCLGSHPFSHNPSHEHEVRVVKTTKCEIESFAFWQRSFFTTIPAAPTLL